MITSANGEPLANIHLPFVSENAFSAVHSDLEVGLESGKIIGRGCLPISLITSSVNNYNNKSG